MKKILLTIFAACFAMSAHAISYNVKLSGELTEILRPTTDPLSLPTLTAWSLEYCLDADSEPLSLRDIFLNTDVNEDGLFTVFINGLDVWTTNKVDLLNLMFGEDLLAFQTSRVTAQTVGYIGPWALVSEIHEHQLYNNEILLRIRDSPLVYGYTGTVNIEVTPKAVPDSGSSVVFAGLGLGVLGFMRRFKGFQ